MGSQPEGLIYRILDETMYEPFDQTFRIDGQATDFEVSFTFHPDKIYESRKQNPGVNYVLPIQLITLSETANAGKDELLMICGFYTYTSTEVTDKSQWKVAYGYRLPIVG